LRDLASIDGRIFSPVRAAIAIEDWGFRFGWGLFETIRIHRGHALFLQQHLDRMRAGGERLRIELGESSWWRVNLDKLIARSRIGEGAVNLMITRGFAPRFQPRRIIVVRPQSGPLIQPGTVWVAPWRIDPSNPMIGCKTLAYFPNMFASEMAAAEGFDDAIVVNSRGRIADGARATVFALEHGTLRTPSFRDGALAGVVRQIILDAAAERGIPVRFGGLTLRSLGAAEGVFLTSSVRGLRLAHRLGARKLRQTARALRVFKELKSAYRRAVERDLRSSLRCPPLLPSPLFY
jgi:branched-chain amino acid aminotransferase